MIQFPQADGLQFPSRHCLHRFRTAMLLLSLIGEMFAMHPAACADIRDDFKNPPPQFRPMPFWHMNGLLTIPEIDAQMEASWEKSQFGGVAVLPVSETRPQYLSEDYFNLYRHILDKARDLGMQVVFYDDINFPSGSAGGKMRQLYPDDVLKRLDKAEEEFAGPGVYTRDLPHGDLMAAVAMNATTLQRIDLTSLAKDGKLTWNAPAGKWKVMVFTLVHNVSNLVDYLSPEAMDKFLSLTYDEFYRRFKEHFGTTIRMTFFDDISFFGNRYWTQAFNEKFRKYYGYDPAPYYPALWYDIGPETDAARAALFGFRSELMSEGWPKKIGDWCRAHGVKSSGHPAGNYEICPVDMGGDDLKFYRYADYPLMDAIFYHGHGRPGYKMVSSSAENYDKPVVVVEIYGAFPEQTTDVPMLYRTMMEIFARGINRVVPHGMWYDPKHVRISPLISHFSDKIGPALPDYSRYVGRCCLLLQGGRHVSDIALFYPIAALNAWYRFDAPENRQFGTFVPPEADYLDVSDALTSHVRRDFTFLHPEVLDAKCTVEGATVRLNNDVNKETYRVVILPGEKVIPWSSLKKIKAFYDAGGKVVATTRLPSESAEFGHDADVQKTIRAMFGPAPSAPAADPYRVRIEVVGSTVKTYVRGVLVDTTVDPTFSKGTVGFREAPEESASFANVVVTSPAGKVLLKDDFSAGLGNWTNTEHAALRDGRLTLANNQVFRSVGGADWDDYSLEVVLSDESAIAGIVFRAVDDNNCYMWQFNPTAKTLRVHKKVNGGWQLIKQVSLTGTDFSVGPFTTNANKWGGKTYFAARPTVGTLQAILDDALPVADVRFEGNPRVTGGNGTFSYIHKVKDGRDLYFIANSSDDAVDTFVRLRGRLSLEVWDPHTGESSPAEEVTHLTEHGQEVTRVRLRLGPVKSVFLVSIP